MTNNAQVAEKLAFTKINFAGDGWCICPPDAVADMTEGCSGFTTEEVMMTQAEYDALPEFQG